MTSRQQSKAKNAAAQPPSTTPAEQPESDAGTPQESVTPEIGRISALRPHEVDVIRQDRSVMLVPNMFVIGGNPGVRLEEKQHIQGIDLRYRFSPMSGYDLRMLHGVATLLQSHMRGEIVTFTADDRQSSALSAWSMLGSNARAFGDYITVLRTSRRQLAEVVGESGVANGQALRRVYESLQRLSEVTIHMTHKESDSEVSTPLLQVARVGGQIAVVVNARMVKTIAQRTVGLFSVTSMRDIRRMKGESTVLLFSRLCGFIDELATQVVGQDKIETYIWGNALPVVPENSEARKGRRKVILKALNELVSFSWTVVEIAGARGTKPSYKLTRPKFSKEQREQLEHHGPEQLNLLPEGRKSSKLGR